MTVIVGRVDLIASFARDLTLPTGLAAAGEANFAIVAAVDGGDLTGNGEEPGCQVASQHPSE